jgi:hypothetical protein
MDGPFYVDTRPPHNMAAFPSVTLTGVNQALIPAGAYPKLGQNYFGYVGKAVRLTFWGILNTGATPGNIGMQLMWGPGTSNVGTTINNWINCSGQANYVNQDFEYQAILRCRALGTSGSLIMLGHYLQCTWGFGLFPNGGVPAATTLDLTQDYVPNLQASRSGSTSESIQIHDFLFEALN